MSRFIFKIFLSVLFLSSTYSSRNPSEECGSACGRETCPVRNGKIETDKELKSSDFREFSFAFDLKTLVTQGKHCLMSKDGSRALSTLKTIFGGVYDVKDVVEAKVGPLFIRMAERGEEWKSRKNLPGHFMLHKNGKDVEYFRFFMPQKFLPATLKQLNLRLAGWCESKDRMCQTIHVKKIRATKHDTELRRDTTDKGFNIESNVVLNLAYNPILSFQLNWIPDEERKIKRVVHSAGKGGNPLCKPELRVVMYEAAPRSSKDNMNVQLRPILAKITTQLELKVGQKMAMESNYKLDVPADIKDKLHFLSRHKDLRKDDYYRCWTKENGVKIAVTFCTCEIYGSSTTYALDDGCVEYEHQQVKIEGDLSKGSSG